VVFCGDFVRRCFASTDVTSVEAGRVSARQPSHFHLLAQMKVAKAKGLMASDDGLLY
jgi:hypothetical protein